MPSSSQGSHTHRFQTEFYFQSKYEALVTKVIKPLACFSLSESSRQSWLSAVVMLRDWQRPVGGWKPTTSTDQSVSRASSLYETFSQVPRIILTILAPRHQSAAGNIKKAISFFQLNPRRCVQESLSGGKIPCSDSATTLLYYYFTTNFIC